MKIFAQFVSSLLGGMLLGIVGLVVGAGIGFPAQFGGNAGYEASGSFFAVLGISAGSLLGMIVVLRFQKGTYKYVTSIIAAAITAIISVVLFDYNMPSVIGLIILLMPPAAQTAITNWQKFSQIKE